MNKSAFSALLCSLFLMTVLAGAAQAAELGTPSTVLTCAPTRADANRSGLDQVTVTKHVWGCNQNGAGPHCFAIGVYYTAEVTVNGPFDGTRTQSFKISFPGLAVAGRGTDYTGDGIELNLGPVVAHPIAHLTAQLKAQDGSPAQEISAYVDCR